MRASTLFAVTIAILLGLAAAITVKVTGYFANRTEAPPARLPEVNVLVAARNIFKGDLIDAPWVRLRPLRADELKDYEQNRDKYVPAVMAATSLRIAAKNIEADRPILREDLEPMVKPEALSTRLLPNMRAVNLSVPKEQSAGGMIQVGEWVDVLFTTQITLDSGTTTRTAAIAHRQRIIAKRNSPWPILSHLPDDKAVNFTLEMNPYRAALVEFSKPKGTLTLLPVSAAEQKTLEAHRAALAEGNDVQPVGFAPLAMEDDSEYQDENNRVDAINKGEVSVGPQDLARIFGIETRQPPLGTTPEKIITVEQYVGNTRGNTAQFGKDFTIYVDPSATPGRPASPKPKSSANGLDFTVPDPLNGILKAKPCPNCKKKKENASNTP